MASYLDSAQRAIGKLHQSYEINAKEIPLDAIVIDEGRRAVSEDTVSVLIESIRGIGLMSPIVVRPRLSGKDVEWVLVAGRHRLEALRRLHLNDPEQAEDSQWSHIPAIVQHLDDVEARLAEIAENLHRSELTKLERSDQIAEWVRLTEQKRAKAQVAPSHTGGRPDQGINAAVRDLGVDRTEAQRAVKIASLSDEAKEAAREAGLDDNQSALLKVARAEPGQQVAVVHQLVHQKAASEPLNDLEANERQVAKLMTAWNGASPDARQEFLLRIEQPIMDRQYGTGR